MKAHAGAIHLNLTASLKFLVPEWQGAEMARLFWRGTRCQATEYRGIVSSRSSARRCLALAIVTIGNVGSSGPAPRRRQMLQVIVDNDASSVVNFCTSLLY